MVCRFTHLSFRSCSLTSNLNCPNCQAAHTGPTCYCCQKLLSPSSPDSKWEHLNVRMWQVKLFPLLLRAARPQDSHLCLHSRQLSMSNKEWAVWTQQHAICVASTFSHSRQTHTNTLFCLTFTEVDQTEQKLKIRNSWVFKTACQPGHTPSHTHICI